MHCADVLYCAHHAGKVFFGVCILSQIHILTCASLRVATPVHAQSPVHKSVHIHTQLHTRSNARELIHTTRPPSQTPSSTRAPIHRRTLPPRASLFAHVFACAFIWLYSCVLFLGRALSILEHISRACTLELACARDDSSLEKGACTTAQGISAALRLSYSIRLTKSLSSHILDTTLVGKYD